jgi:hypothetical protein
VKIEQTSDGIKLTVPPINHQEPDTVIKLDLDGSAMDVPPIKLAGN